MELTVRSNRQYIQGVPEKAGTNVHILMYVLVTKKKKLPQTPGQLNK